MLSCRRCGPLSRRGRPRKNARRSCPNLARDLALTIDIARKIASDFAREVHTLQIDASGVDLTEVDITNAAVLDGVIWDEETRWPPGVRDSVEPPVSEEIWPGVYRVRTGDAPDRSHVPSA
jgi:hypothetical protein